MIIWHPSNLHPVKYQVAKCSLLFFANISLPVTPRPKMIQINFEVLKIVYKKCYYSFTRGSDRLRDTYEDLKVKN